MVNEILPLNSANTHSLRQNSHSFDNTKERSERASQSSKLRIARDKITRVFRYLEALNHHRNPVQHHLGSQPWSLWLRDLPYDSSFFQRGKARSNADALNLEDAASQTQEVAVRENIVFKVRRPILSRPPEPPQEIAGWLK